MKKRINIMLDEAAVLVLDKQPNKSKYIEDLILGVEEHKPISKVVEDYIIESLDEIKAAVADLELRNKNAFEHAAITGGKLVVPPINGLSSNGRTVDFDSTNLGSSPSEPAKSSVSEKPSVYKTPQIKKACCSQKKPCRHWQWISEKDYWINSLTGEIREE